MIQDFRQVFRFIKRSKGLAIGVVISMGLGVGAAASVFSFVDSFVFRPLPIPETNRVVHIANATPANSVGDLSYPEYQDYSERSQSFSGIATYGNISIGFAPNPADQPRVSIATLVSGNFFSTLQVKPAIGRGFLPEEDSVPGRDAVVVFSYKLWQRDFDANPGVVGRTVAIDGHPFTVVGVAPEEFLGVESFIEPEIYVPRMMIQQAYMGLDTSSLTNRFIRYTGLVARLRPGISVEQAQLDVGRIANQLESEHPETNKGVKAVVLTQFSYRLAARPGNLSFAAILLVVGFLVLGIACVNVSNLLLSTVPARTRDMAIRVAMGAPRTRLLGQLLLESVILSSVGALVGLSIAFWCADFLSSVNIGSADLHLHFPVQVDHRVVIFVIVVGLVSAFLSGAIPAWRCSRNDLNYLLKSSDPRNRPQKIRARQILVGIQVTVSTLVLVFSGLLMKELRIAAAQNPGFRVDNLLTMSLDPTTARVNIERAQSFYATVIEQVSAVPGVKSAAIAQDKPFGVVNNGLTNLTIEGYELPANQQEIPIRSAFVGIGYFATLDIPIIRGRAFDSRDGVNAPLTVIVNETMAQRYWPNRDPLGARVKILGAGDRSAQVIGIARNSKYGSMNERPLPFLYRSYDQSQETGAALFVETHGDPETVKSVLAELRSIAPHMPIFDIRTMQEHVRQSGLLEPRLGAWLSTPLGVVGLLLGVLGLYGVIAYSVGQRSFEIGIRMAVGASNRDVLRMVLFQGLKLSGIASLIGIVLALALSGMTKDMVSYVKTDDPSIYIGVFLFMLIVTGAACYIPARRASMVDPNVTLRS